MSTYEKEQEKLAKLWNEVLSEEENDPFQYSSEDYEPSDLDCSSSDSEQPLVKRKKSSQIPLAASTSTHIVDSSVASTSYDAVADTIEDVISMSRTHDLSDVDEHLVPSITWAQVSGDNLKSFQFTAQNTGVLMDLFENFIDKTPVDFFKLFLDDDTLELLVTETNRYAGQKKISNSLPRARIKKWKDTYKQEMEVFIGLQIWMGLVHLPRLADYWSGNTLYKNKVSQVMSRNRFELLLSSWHFSNNANADPSDRLYKISPLIKLLVANFEKYFTPKEHICIDETLVPFRGRLSFLQYIKNKRHKFGVKLFKLCVEGGYTYDFRIYCGQEKRGPENVATSVVMKLCDPLLDNGRTIYVDNYYTSVELAHKLLERKTHLVGTLRKNRKNNPKDVITKKLKKGESFSQESSTGIVVTKWQDKRDVLTMSTKHTGEMIKVSSGRNPEKEKPDSVVDYNKCKAFIDLSDQMKSYSSSLRKGIKWYRKIAVELLLGSSMVNAYLLYKTVTGNNMSITEFREQVAESLLDLANKINTQQPPMIDEKHKLEDVGTSNRRRCVSCYSKLSEANGRSVAVKKTPHSRWKCVPCNKHYCVTCFCDTHNCTI